MKALTFHGRRDIRLEEIAAPQPGPGEVLIRVTDSLLAQGMVDFNMEGHLIDLSTPHPATGIGLGYVMGQQYGGVIEAVGDGVDPDRIGQQVGVAPGIGCGECESCRSGHANHCELYRYYGLLGLHGGMAPYSVVRAENACPVPRRDLASLLEGLLVVHNLARKAKPWLSDAPLLCLGAGPIGLCAASVFQDLFDQPVILHDVLPGRRKRAEQAGFRIATEADLERKYHLVLDCAGTNPETGGSAMLDGLGRVAKGGAMMVVGTYLHETPISILDVLFREVTIATSFAYSDQDLTELLPRLGELKLDFEQVAERISLETAATEGLLRGEVDRDSYTALIVEP